MLNGGNFSLILPAMSTWRSSNWFECMHVTSKPKRRSPHAQFDHDGLISHHHCRVPLHIILIPNKPQPDNSSAKCTCSKGGYHWSYVLQWPHDSTLPNTGPFLPLGSLHAKRAREQHFIGGKVACSGRLRLEQSFGDGLERSSYLWWRKLLELSVCHTSTCLNWR